MHVALSADRARPAAHTSGLQSASERGVLVDAWLPTGHANVLAMQESMLLAPLAVVWVPRGQGLHACSDVAFS